MALTFINHTPLPRWAQGVYRMTIDGKWFYIGSSVDLRRRLGGWKHNLTKDNCKKNCETIRYVLQSNSLIEFEILEYVPYGTDPKHREKEWLEDCISDKMCLNLVSDPFTCKRVKVSPAYRPKPKKIKPVYVRPDKPIAVYNRKLEEINRLPNIASALRVYGINRDEVRLILNGKRHFTKEYTFREILPNGAIKDAPTRERKKYKQRHSKAVHRVDSTGNILETYPSIRDAAAAIGCNHSSISCAITGYKGCKKAHGHYFKFAV